MKLKGSTTNATLARWARVFKVMRVETHQDNIVLVAAGVAFYAVLAVLPALVIAVSLYGLFTDLAEAERQIESILDVLPGSAAGIVATQMRSIARASEMHLTVGFVVSLLAFAWTVSNATRAIVRGVKIAYDQEDGRSVLERRAVAVGVTVAVIIVTVIGLAIIAAVPVWLRRFDPTDAVVTFGNFRWILVGIGFATIAGLLYRYAPPERPDGWHSVAPGMAVATAVWTVTSIGFSLYVSSFGRYNETYGTLGAAVVLLLWFWFTALAILIGAELNEALARERPSTPDGTTDAAL